MRALTEMFSRDQLEPEGWYRCPTDGRYRPDGDPDKEYIDP